MRLRRFRSDPELEAYAQRLRRTLGIEFLQFFDLKEVLTNFSRVFTNFRLNVVPDRNLTRDEGYANARNKTVTLTESTWEGALLGDRRALMTIFHELAHIALGHEGDRFRTTGVDFRSANRPSIQADESEAKRFGGMLLAPSYMISDYNSPEEIAANFPVSFSAAEVRYAASRSLERRTNNKLRTLPDIARQFLEQRKALGHKVESLDLSPRSSDIGKQMQAALLGYELIPCSECNNLTVVRRGGELLCDTCGESRGCGC